MGANLNFVHQQGFTETNTPACEYTFPALMFQPRVIFVLLALGILIESGWYFIVLGAILWWNVLVPRLNPFDLLYDALVLKRKGHAAIGPARPPRRFSQGMAGTLMLATGVSMLTNHPRLAWAFQVLLLIAVALLVFARFCAGAYIYHHLTGKRTFANKTLPWVRSG